jgi:methylated-DNA-protein-cysteine methyltransferase related protein
MKRKKNDSKTDFFADVYAVVKLIPKGRVTSYGAIAHFLGTKMSARMVGWAMHQAPAGIPAHRVVNRQGLLTGKHHFNHPDTMEKRLAKEGVQVEQDCIIDFNRLFWDPSVEFP